jgi:CrcB protein
MMALLYVGLGGALGTALRFFIIRYVPVLWLTSATFIANIIACFILGIVLQKTNITPHSNLKLLLTTGFCGGLSTFSTMIWELYQYHINGQMMYGLLYLVLSVLVGIGALIVGLKWAIVL